MTCYIISYDLRKVRDYDTLIKGIKSYGKRAKILESTRAIVTSSSAVQIRDHLQGLMDADDGLFVIKSGTESARRKVLCDSQRLKDNL